MVQKQFQVVNPLGVHTRPATAIAKAAGHFSSDIRILLDESRQCNAKSMIHVTASCIKTGQVFIIQAVGPDEQEAMEALEQVLKAEIG